VGKQIVAFAIILVGTADFAVGQQAGVVPSSPVAPDLRKFNLSQRHFTLAGQRGADWLQRANGPDGRFLYGYVPSLRTPLEGNDFLAQAGAAFAIARASHAFQDERFAAIARQALLTLLLDTVTDPDDENVRCTRLPSELLDRVAAAGMLTMAIHELPEPSKDLLEQSDGLCLYLRRQQRPDGSFTSVDKNRKDVVDGRTSEIHAGAALYGLIRSQRHLPAAWKVESVRNARRFYMASWHKNKTMEFVPWHTAAYTEAYLQTKDKTFADSVFEMNDWLCAQQFERFNLPTPQWTGGFKRFREGKELRGAPDMETAKYAMSLADACRTARQAGDVTRWQRYRSALEMSLQFVTTHQYTDANTQHFAELYRPVLVGAFHPSQQDGNLRLDCTQYAVAALAHYVEFVMTVEQ